MEFVPVEEFNALKQQLEKLEVLLSKKIIPNQRLLTQVQACKYLNRSPGTINTLVKKGHLKQVIEPSLNGKDSNPKYDIKELDKYISKHTKDYKKYDRSKK